MTFTLPAVKQQQANDLLRKLQMLCVQTEQGIIDCERVCECFVQYDCPTAFDFCTDINPTEGKLAHTLTRLISIENTMLDCIEEVQSFAENKFKLFVASSTSTGPHTTHSQAPYKKGNVPPLYSAQGFQGIELHKYLQVNEHIDRVCECSDHLTALQELLHDTDNEEAFHVVYNTDEEDNDSVMFLRSAIGYGSRNRKTMANIGSQFEKTVQHFEKVVTSLNKLLLQVV